MTSTMTSPFRHSLAALAAVALFTACADRTPAGPDTRSAGPASATLLTPAEAQAAAFGPAPDLGSCQSNLQLPEGSKVSFHVFGKGVQIYRWDGTAWRFVNPAADLFADAGGIGLVGTHFGTPGGPAWKTLSGSEVVGTVTGRCTPNPDAIPWVRLDAAASGSGVFENTTFIHRLNTVGGNAPSAPGATVGDEARVPYTADYFFYRAP
jgi:hypothetical protein